MKVKVTLPKKNYQPGQVLKGQCEWDMQSRKKPKFIRVVLKVWNEGTHSQTTAVAKMINFKTNSPTGVVDFEFKLPLYPFSYQGKNFNLCWGVQGELGNDVYHCCNFYLGNTKS